MAKLSINEDCIGCGQCAGISPELFEVKERKSHPKKTDLNEEETKKAKIAAENCPVSAISVSE